jgi:hypothetical protein
MALRFFWRHVLLKNLGYIVNQNRASTRRDCSSQHKTRSQSLLIRIRGSRNTLACHAQKVYVEVNWIIGDGVRNKCCTHLSKIHHNHGWLNNAT